MPPITRRTARWFRAATQPEFRSNQKRLRPECNTLRESDRIVAISY
jgi:hypothetical protein